jgi:sugar lactone lactonase YvrE
LPDAPADDVVLVNGHLVLASDFGVMISSGPHGGTWTRLGTNLPNASVNDLQLSPDGSYILAATHGRGLWTIPTPAP